MRTLISAFEFWAPEFGMTVKDLHRTVRYCREQGLIPHGRAGPGGAPAQATPRTMRAVLIGLLASPNRGDAGAESLACGMLPTEDRRRCQLTGSIHFAGALDHVLADPSVAARVERIVVSRPVAAARIEYRDDAVRRDGDTPSEQRFGRAPAGLTWVESILDGAVLHQMANDIRQDEEETGEWTTDV